MNLSPRETDVLRLLAAGMTTKEAAKELGLAECTVKTYAKAIRAKAGEQSMCAVVLKAERAGLLEGVEV